MQVAAFPLQLSPSPQIHVIGVAHPVVDPSVQFDEFRVGPEYVIKPVQLVDNEANPFTGQTPLDPLQASATSQMLVAERHPIPAAFTTSAGQLFDTPSQFSTTSQVPASPRHWVDALDFRSAGQTELLPEQFSGGSQTPAETWQTVVLGRNESTGHSAPFPGQFSATSHPPATAARHTVAALRKESAGH